MFDRKTYNRLYYEAHKEAIKAQSKIYNDTHKEEVKARHKIYYEAHKEKLIVCSKLHNKVHREEIEARRLRKEYNLTLENKRSMWKEQDGKCSICKKKLTESKDCHVDHCHTTGKVRGLLCRKCNLILGYASDNLIVLQGAINYIRENL